MKVRGSILKGILPDRKKIKIRLEVKNGIERLILALINIFYFLHNPSNLVSLAVLNNIGIFYYNKYQMLYNQGTWETFTYVKQYTTYYFLYLLNSALFVNLLKNNDIYSPIYTR